MTGNSGSYIFANFREIPISSSKRTLSVNEEIFQFSTFDKYGWNSGEMRNPLVKFSLFRCLVHNQSLMGLVTK